MTTNQTSAADIAWRTFFAEERLQRLIEVALVNNRDLRVAMLNVAQSWAQYHVTRSALFPTVDGNASYTRTHASGRTADGWSASLGSTAYEVDLFGRVRSQNRQALETFFATAEAQRSAKLSLVAEVAAEYFVLRQAEEQIALAQETLISVEDSYALNQANFDAGATSELDLRTAEGQVQTAKINLLTYERARAQAVNYLVVLIGQGVPTNLPPASPFNATNLVAEVSPGLPSELLQQRPDILEA
jgi:outer membrane protein, multidrug efflux system